MPSDHDQDEISPPLQGHGNLAELLPWAAARWGERVALVHDGSELTYTELERRSQLAAAFLCAAGVRPGDRVGLQLANSPAFVTLYFGILRLGAIVVPQSHLATAAEAAINFADAGVRVVLRGAEVRGSELPAGAGTVDVRRIEDPLATRQLDAQRPLAGVQPVADSATAVILYTSGTTGHAKGAELTHANLGRNANAAIEIYDLVAADVVLAALPLYHSYGQVCTLHGPLAVGARIVLAGRFDATTTVELIERERVSLLLGVPTMFSDLAHCAAADDALASLRLCGAGGAALAAEIRERFESRFGVVLGESYGLTETSPIASFNWRHGERLAGTIGWPIRGTEMRIVDSHRRPLPAGIVGEIAIRGHNVMKGYWRNPAATREAIDAQGWFYSGDLGTAGTDGSFRVVGRVKDVIIRGGSNVYPRELEDLIIQHPEVEAVAVIGVPDPRLGEEIGAAVVLAPGATLDADELRAWARERIALNKYPRHIWFVDELPKGPTGKILKRAIVPPLSEAH